MRRHLSLPGYLTVGEGDDLWRHLVIGKYSLIRYVFWCMQCRQEDDPRLIDQDNEPRSSDQEVAAEAEGGRSALYW